MGLKDKSIADLISDLDFALMARNKEPGFSYLEFWDNPADYNPVTAREIQIWEELTDPRRRQELLDYPSTFQTRSGWPFSRLPRYHRYMYECVLEASDERITRTSGNRPSESLTDHVESR